MTTPRLDDLPPLLEERKGWPWTVHCPPLPETLPNGKAWPRVTIVTASYNQGRYIEETIRSVLLQGYPNLEYIVVDGGSTDGSVDIIRKYESWLAYWVSEPDKGPGDALAKGFARASGEIFAWLNSDDILLPWAVGAAVITLLREESDAIYGHRLRMQEDGFFFDFDIAPGKITWWKLCIGTWLPQETVFFQRRMYEQVGGISDDTLAFDYDLWVRFVAAGARFVNSGVFLGAARYHPASIQGARRQLLLAHTHRSRMRYLGTTRLRRAVIAGSNRAVKRVVFTAWRMYKRSWVLRRRIQMTERGWWPQSRFMPFEYVRRHLK